MNTPMNALVSDMVNLLDERLREDFEERAGIIEFDAELPRDHAECLALLDVLHRHPSALCDVTVLPSLRSSIDSPVRGSSSVQRRKPSRASTRLASGIMRS